MSMKKKIKNTHNQVKKVFFIVLLLFLAVKIQSQDSINKWAIGIGAGGVLYAEEDISSIGFQFSEQFPRLKVARYMFSNITLAGSFSQSVDDRKTYITFDGEVRYDFGTSKNLINIYALVGGSLIYTSSIDPYPFANFGVGGTLWVYKNFGLQGQIIYKYNSAGFETQASHVFGSGGIVYRLNVGNKFSVKSRKKNRTRLWEMKH